MNSKRIKKERRCGIVIISLITTIFVYKYACIQMKNSELKELATLGENLLEYSDAVIGIISAYLAVIVAKLKFRFN